MRSPRAPRVSGTAGLLGLVAIAAMSVPSIAVGTTTLNCTTSGSVIISADGLTVSSGASCEGTVALPETVTTVATSAFQNASGLRTITLPAGLTTIGSNAFRGATGLTSITIPSGVTSIGYSVFLGATGLSSVVFAGPSSVASIGNSAFWNADALRSITLPASVTSIAYDAFSSRMDRVYLSGDAPTIPSGVTQFYGIPASAIAYRFSTASGFGSTALWRGFNLGYWMPPPAAPGVVAGDAAVTATAVAASLGPPPNGYTVTAVEDARKSCTIGGPSGTCVIAGLSNGTAYTFTATAFDAYATSAASVASATVTPAAAPAPESTPTAPAASSPSRPAALRGVSLVCRGRTCTTRGRVPNGAAAITQVATTGAAATSRQAEGLRARPATRRSRCRIIRPAMRTTTRRTYICTLRLARGSWRITTTAVSGRGGIVGLSVLDRRLK